MPAECETIIVVNVSDCDDLEHLNHVRAVRYLERARSDWYRACGLWDGGNRNRYGTVVVNVHFNYRRECFRGERLRVLTRAQSMGNKSFTLTQEIIKPDETVAIDGEATSVIMDLDSRSIVPVPSCLAAHLAPRHSTE